jgi:hypothetical protein
MTSDSYFYGTFARALMAQRDGDAAEAQRIIRTILSQRPQWKNPRREIGKLIIDPAIADRLARDFAAAGPHG